MASERLIDRVGKVAKEGLIDLGFRKRSGQIYTLDVGGDVIGWLGLNSATEHLATGHVEVNPVIGIRHQAIERIVAELQDLSFHPYQPPTVSRPLGYLMPAGRYIGWQVDTANSEPSVADLVIAVKDYGVPFIGRNRDLNAICTLLEEGMGFEHQLVYRRPVAWLLAGERDRARSSLGVALTRLGDREDPAAQQLRRFSSALEERLAT